MARTHKGRMHHYTMLVAFLADLLVLKPMMYNRATSAWSPSPWEVSRIAPHLLLSFVVAVFGIVSLYLGFKFRVRKDRRMFLPPKGRLHKTIGVLFIVLWTIAFVTGVLIFHQTYFA